MENQNGNNSRRTAAVAFLLGAMAGGIAALLFTPRTGAQMRSGLKRDARALRDRGSHLAHEAGEKVATMKGTASEARIAYVDEMDKRRAAARSAVAEKGEQA